MLFILSSSFLLAACVLIVALFELDRLHMWILAVALFWSVVISLEARALSLGGLLGSRLAWVLADLVVLVVAREIWRRRGRPAVLPPVSIEAIQDTFASGWLRGALLGASALVGVLYAVLLVATVLIPQNLDDVLTAYLARIGYWIQRGDLGSYAASAYNSVQVSYPRNAQFPLLRSIVLLGNDRLVGIEQWAAALLGVVAIFGLARAIGARRDAAWFCGLVWALVPTVAVQAGIALTDLVSVNLLLLTLMFGLVGWQSQRRAHLALATISFAMFVGTKQIATFVAPGLAVLLLYALVRGRGLRRRWITWMAASVPVMVVLGLLDYLQNQIYYGNPLGDPDSFELFAVKATTAQRVAALSSNLRRAALDSALADLPAWIAGRLPGIGRVRVYDAVIGTGGYLDGSQAWAGLFVTAILAVGMLLALYQLVRYRRFAVLAVLVPAVLYVLMFFWTRTNYSAAFSRYLLVPEALCLPAAAVGLSGVRVEWRAGHRVLSALSVVVVMGVGTQALHAGLRSGHRPLYGPQAVWSQDRIELLGRSTGFGSRFQLMRAFDYIDRCYPDTDRIGLLVPSKFPQSLLFGPAYDRHVSQFSVPFPPVLDDAFLADRRLDLAVVERTLFDEVKIGGISTRVRVFGPIAVVGVRGDAPPTC